MKLIGWHHAEGSSFPVCLTSWVISLQRAVMWVIVAVAYSY